MTGAPGRFWRDADGLHVDTRGLAPPDPLVAVLWHLEQPGQRGPVTAYFDRFPVHLFPELAERGWRHTVLLREAGDVCLLLSKAS